MKNGWNRRQVLAWSALALAPCGRAAAWPHRPLRLVVPSAPSTPGDSVARALSDVLAERLGQPVVVDNRSGAQGFIGLEAVAKAEADGHTVGLLNIQQAIIPAMRRKLPIDLGTALKPVVQLTSEATVLVVSDGLPVQSGSELLQYLRSQPGLASYGSSGNGSPSHVGMELLARSAQFEALHVPYRSPAAVITEMAGGRLQLALLNSAPVIQALATGKIRALAVSSARRLARLPQVPTFSEAGLPVVDLRGWVGVVAPAATPAAIVQRLNADINQALADPRVVQRLRAGGSEPAGGTPEAFAAHIAAETRRWGDVVRQAGIRMD